MKKFIKWLFKYRRLSYKQFSLYLFPRQRHEIGVGVDIDGYTLFYINLIFITFEIEFAPNSYYKNIDNTSDKLVKDFNELSEEEKETILTRIFKSIE